VLAGRFRRVASNPAIHWRCLGRNPSEAGLFGEIAVSYVVVARGEGRSRLLAKLSLRWRPRWPWRWMRVLLPWGDLFMMRKQLLTLKRLAERAARGV
jgi:hypothetical protein